jgi:2-polyprenyl-3-methyl-5-hydroxy-6-metoxy-1,4-benzoquinol methylase
VEETVSAEAQPQTPAINLEERLFGAAVGALELFGVYLGDRLGLYRELRDPAGLTPAELARRAGIHPRYAQEWLEQQAVAGVLAVEGSEGAAERRYHLPQAQARVVDAPTDGSHLAPLARMIVGIGGVIEEVVQAYRNGTGVPYSHYGPDFRHGQGGINRPAFTTSLVEEWIPAMPGIAERLARGGRVADLGCGHGWSAIAVARAFPRATVLGIDADAASVDDARGFAAHTGASVRFDCASAAALAGSGPFDLVMLLEVLHDLARPVEVLKEARRALAPDGALLVADEAVAPEFTAPGDDLERMMYGWSITHCLPTQMAEQPSAAIGTVIREGTVRELAAAAGFGSVEVLPVNGGFFRIYDLRAR